MLGQAASSQTVCRPSRRTRPLSSVYSGPITALVLIQDGLRSIGVWALRTSRRSILRPSGTTGVSDKDGLQTECFVREVLRVVRVQDLGEGRLDQRRHLGERSLRAGLG